MPLLWSVLKHRRASLDILENQNPLDILTTIEQLDLTLVISL